MELYLGNERNINLSGSLIHLVYVNFFLLIEVISLGIDEN